MKTISLAILAFILSVASFAQNVLPKSNAFVTDKANVLSRDEIQLLERRLKALNDSTSNQIAVVLIPTLDGQNLEDYANKLFRTWGIGGAGASDSW
ncbi:TPM domain-containing protein [Pinibacter aurantiacus]|uniref:TPM domain-containing protein n=1 Tax=Pinibacter aurantiacus TaxID=2851599 RepID=A0A9E2SBM7_9BACT|nr:TPM domain-containing protein [Pinibacter aurantiacus]MBV4358372.1 TPM domain-containing protein [Pinibacter aurantiacus]